MPRKQQPASVTLGQNIKAFRKARGSSQAELAAKIGVDQTQISSYERGTLVPPVERLLALAKVLGTTTDVLLNNAVAKETLVPRTAKAWKTLERVLQLPRSEQRHVIKNIEYVLGRYNLSQSSH